ncbi:preprotein translocase subunit YajC [Eubacteriales bacterium KG127]
MGSGLGANFLLLGVFVVAMYFLLIRPQKKKEKAVAAMRDGVQVGDKIVTIGGICGKVVKTNAETLVIQVGADKTKFEIMRWAISSVTDKSKASSYKSNDEKEVKKFSPKSLKKAPRKETVETESKAEKVKHDVELAVESGTVKAEETKEELGDLSV